MRSSCARDRRIAHMPRFAGRISPRPMVCRTITSFLGSSGWRSRVGRHGERPGSPMRMANGRPITTAGWTGASRRAIAGARPAHRRCMGRHHGRAEPHLRAAASTAYTQLNSGLSNDVVYGVSVEGDNVWVATAAGACRLNTRTGQWALYNERNTPMVEIWTYGVCSRDRQGLLRGMGRRRYWSTT